MEPSSLPTPEPSSPDPINQGPPGSPRPGEKAAEPWGWGDRAWSLILFIGVRVGLLLTLLPTLAIGRGVAALITHGGRPGFSGVLGTALAFSALITGALFFAYSVRSYLATTVALALGLLGSGRNGNGQPGSNIVAHPAGLSRIRNGNGAGQRTIDRLHEPFVSIHIATYNEQRVIGRLLEACGGLDYRNYEVIVVDDSTDGSAEILRRWQGQERFKILHRSTRDGFKGGALQEALARMDARTEYVVVFDADAVPFADTIQRFLNHFYETPSDGSHRPRSEVAAVQSYQWHVLNKSENWLTEAVRAEYAGSYMVERPFQQVVGSMRMVAGTAYMIRADVLRELGWGRSLTEDWELTLRLYERGWKVVYTPYAEAPAECVATFGRLVRQRMRWAEGHTYNVRKFFGRILRSPAISITEKIEFLIYAPYYLQALFFLLGTSAWLVAEIVLKASVPAWTALLGWSLLFSNLLALPLMNAGGLLLEEAPGRDYHGVLGALAVSYALVPFQAWAALKGLVERDEGPWYRTPKTGRITDPISHLHRLKRLQRWLLRPAGRRGGRPVNLRSFSRLQRPRRIGWMLTAAVLIVLGGLIASALQAPVVQANPDQLFLRNTTSSTNPADQTLDVQGSLLASALFSNGTSATWLSATSYSSGSVASGTYTFKLDWITNSCGLLSSACTTTVTWGYCNSGCTSLQPAAATFTFTLDSSSGQLGTASQTATGSSMTLSGCPCNFYVRIASTTGGTGAWTLGYNGNVGTLCSVNQCSDTNITTPTLPVPELVLGVAPLALAIPLLIAARLRRSRA